MGTFSETVRNGWLDNFTAGTVFVKLHTADPGSAGTANPAANTTRGSAAFGVAAAGTVSNTGTITWASVPNTETYSHVSLWNHVTAGTFRGSDQLSSDASVIAGDTFRITVGDLDLTIT